MKKEILIRSTQQTNTLFMQTVIFIAVFTHQPFNTVFFNFYMHLSVQTIYFAVHLIFTGPCIVMLFLQ